jgi:hypothetical protein
MLNKKTISYSQKSKRFLMSEIKPQHLGCRYYIDGLISEHPKNNGISLTTHFSGWWPIVFLICKEGKHDW